MDHVRENGEIYSNSVSKYFLNVNFANNIILCSHISHAYFVFSLAQQIYSYWVICNNMA